MTTHAGPGPLCIGRFSLSLPPGWVVAGRSQKMYLVALDDDLPPPPPGAQAADPPLAQLSAGLPPRAPLVRRFDLEGVGPAAWFGFGKADSVDRQLVALGGPATSPLRLQALATRGREPVAEKALRMLAAGYHPGARTGFCLAQGAMQLEASRNEMTELSLELPQQPGVEFTLSTRTVDKPDLSHPMADPEAEVKGAAGAGVAVRLQPQVARTVAGLSGKELRGEFGSAQAPPTRIYRFFHAGVGRQAGAPLMTLSLDGPASQTALLDAAWDALLNSLQPVPPH